MANNVHKFRSIKHGDPDKKLKMIPDASRKAVTLLAFAALAVLCALVALAIVYFAHA